jgi:hypothetical protein
MPKIKEYQTRLPESITGNEYTVVTDTIESKTYKVNMKNYVDSLIGQSGGSDAVIAHELAYDHTSFATHTEVSGTMTTHEDTYDHTSFITLADVPVNHTHSNKANLDTINQDLATTSIPSFAGLGTLSRAALYLNNVMICGGGSPQITSSYNLSVFPGAGENQSGGYNDGNVFIGYQAGRGVLGVSSADDCIVIGYQAGYSLTSASQNIMMGYVTGLSTNSGSNNIFLGASSAGDNTTGSNNVAIGVSSFARNRTGSNNISIGYSSGNGASNNSYNRCISIGVNSGASLSDGSDYNTFVGYHAGDNITTGVGNICIGKNAQLSAPDTSYQCMLGGIDADAVMVGINNSLDVGGEINTTIGYAHNGFSGVSTDTFTTLEGKSVTISGGIITGATGPSNTVVYSGVLSGYIENQYDVLETSGTINILLSRGNVQRVAALNNTTTLNLPAKPAFGRNWSLTIILVYSGFTPSFTTDDSFIIWTNSVIPAPNTTNDKISIYTFTTETTTNKIMGCLTFKE